MAGVMFWLVLVVVLQGGVTRPPNPCGEVPSCSCTVSESIMMDCEGAELSQVPVSTDEDAHKIVGLALSDNRIGSLPAEAFTSYPGVRYLYMSNCGTRSVHKDAFRNLGALEELDLSFNPLRELHADTFAGNAALRTLSLMGNEFLRLPPEGPILSSRTLAKLYLSYCGIGELPRESFAALPNLKHLDLASNKLVALPTVTLRPLKLLEELKVDGNEWRCDCGLHELLSWTGRLRGLQARYRDTRCIAENGRDLVLWSYEEQGKRCVAEMKEDRRGEDTTTTPGDTWTTPSTSEAYRSQSNRASANNSWKTQTERVDVPVTKTIHSRKPKIISQKDRDVDEEIIEVKVVEERRSLNSFKPDEISLGGKVIRAGSLEPGALYIDDRDASVSKDKGEGIDGQASWLSSRFFHIMFIVVLACTTVAVVVLTILLIKYTCSAGRNVYRRMRLYSQNSHQYEIPSQP